MAKVGNEAGMCLGINDFTNYAPIADWVGEGSEGIWVAHTWRCLPCVRPVGAGSGSHTSQKNAMYAPPVGTSARRAPHRGLVREEDPATLGRMMYDDLFAVPERLF